MNVIKNDPSHVIAFDGVEAFIMHHPDDKYEKFKICGWTMKHFEWDVGDILLSPGKKDRHGRYKILEIDRPGKPSDMYFASIIFFPGKISSDEMKMLNK